MLEATDPVGDEEERISAAREGLISNYEEIIEIPDPPPTATPTLHSKGLSEREIVRNINLNRLPHSPQKGRHFTSI